LLELNDLDLYEMSSPKRDEGFRPHKRLVQKDGTIVGFEEVTPVISTVHFKVRMNAYLHVNVLPTPVPPVTRGQEASLKKISSTAALSIILEPVADPQKELIDFFDKT